jgi:hypothetical protein
MISCNTSPHDKRNTSPHDKRNTSPHDKRNTSPHDKRNTSPHDKLPARTHQCRPPSAPSRQRCCRCRPRPQAPLPARASPPAISALSYETAYHVQQVLDPTDRRFLTHIHGTYVVAAKFISGMTHFTAYCMSRPTHCRLVVALASQCTHALSLYFDFQQMLSFEAVQVNIRSASITLVLTCAFRQAPVTLRGRMLARS